MRGLQGSRWRLFAAAALGAVVVVVAGSYGYAAITATDQMYTGCLQSGSVTNVAIGSAPLKQCTKQATQISWSQTGPPGTPGSDGVSVTSATEPAGANCPDGGSKFTAANGVSYACNGAKGDTGEPGGSSLAALEGTPCTTASGEAATVSVSVASNGIVNIGCFALADVSVTFSGVGSMNRISITSDVPEFTASCDNASQCSGEQPKGHTVIVSFNADNHNFEYKCPDDPTSQTASATPINQNLTIYVGNCSTPLGLVGDYAVTGTFLNG